MRRLALVGVGLALAAGIAGYVIVGQPQLPASPATPPVINPALTPEAEQASQALLENYGDVRAWLTLSDAMIRGGRTELAVDVLQQAIERIPGDVNLWVQLGVALVAHAGGEVVPAARLAFDRASRLAPDHPAPTYYLGLSWMQSGEAERALAVWRPLLARTPADAPWRANLEQQVQAADMLLRMEAAQAAQPGRPAQEGTAS